MADKQWYEEPKEAWRIVLSDHERGYDSRTVGVAGVTSIKRVPREGMHSNIPHLEVWRGDVLAEEWCQHHIKGVVWVEPPKVPDDDLPF